MTTIELHPEFLTSEGKRQFAVIPYEEYIRLTEFIEDAQDLYDLRTAREQNEKEQTFTLEDVRKDLGIE